MNSSRRSSHGDAIGRVLRRIDAIAAAVRPEFPVAADQQTGAWQTAVDGRWTGGFWVGLLWLAHHYSGAGHYAVLAEEWMPRLETRIEIPNVLNGLVFYYGAALGAVLAGHPKAGGLAMRAAQALGGIYHPVARLFPLGGDTTEIHDRSSVEVNVDGLPGMELLHWAAHAKHDAELASRAVDHVRRVIRACQRPDGSMHQTAGFDPDTGDLRRTSNPRGYAPGSTWARAQSWGMLGLVQAARHDPELVAPARAAADFWMARTAADPVAFWDFDDPAIPSVERDTSATAMAAVALLKLSSLIADEPGAPKYRLHAEVTVATLVETRLTPTSHHDGRPVGMLTDGCWQKKDHVATRSELIWGDYFLFEALLRLEGRVKIP